MNQGFVKFCNSALRQPKLVDQFGSGCEADFAGVTKLANDSHRNYSVQVVDEFCDVWFFHQRSEQTIQAIFARVASEQRKRVIDRQVDDLVDDLARVQIRESQHIRLLKQQISNRAQWSLTNLGIVLPRKDVDNFFALAASFGLNHVKVSCQSICTAYDSPPRRRVAIAVGIADHQ